MPTWTEISGRRRRREGRAKEAAPLRLCRTAHLECSINKDAEVVVFDYLEHSLQVNMSTGRRRGG